MAFELVLALALVAANGFFVAVEFSLARVRPTQIAEWERQGRAGVGSVRHGVEHIDAYLAACQLGITLASLGLGALGKPVFEELFEPLLGPGAELAGIGVAGGLAFGLITLLHVVVGELSPKSLAIARTERTVLAVAPPMRLFYLVLKPFVDGFNLLGNLLLKPFGVPPASESGHAPHSEDELRSLVRESSRSGLIDAEEERFTENVLTFGDRRTREVMVPRPEVRWLPADAGAQDAVRLARETGFTRIPLTEADGGLDAPAGVLHVKDLLAPVAEGRAPRLGDLARPVPRVSESVALDELLSELRGMRQHLALVVDEHGTTVGLITLEDVLEELVGEIEDEFDPEAEALLRPDGDGGTLVDAGAPLRLLEGELGVELDDDRQEATFGGYLVERLGRVPDVGEVIEVDDRRTEVLEVGEGRLRRLRVAARED